MEQQQDQRDQFRDIVLAAMDRKGWTAEETARRAGIAQNTMTRVTHAMSVKVGTVRKLRAALGIEALTTAQSREGYGLVIDTVCSAVAIRMRDLTPEQLGPTVARVMKALEQPQVGNSDA